MLKRWLLNHGRRWAWLGLLWIVPSAGALTLQPTRLQPTDLEVSGLLGDLPAGEKRFVARDEIVALGTTKLELDGEFLPGPQEVTVVFLSDLWRALPRAAGADTVLAICKDGYASVYTEEFMARCRPFIVVAINGLGAEHWPPPGLAFNPGPYVVSVAASVSPAVAGLLDAGHKKPWGVVALEVVKHDAAFAGFYTQPLAGPALAGRDIWINSCASCHRGPPGTFGGTKADRMFDVVAAHARRNPDYFKQYVRAPQSFVSSAKMEPHPHYTDAQLAELIAFLTAVPITP